jgi:hypothetical protein
VSRSGEATNNPVIISDPPGAYHFSTDLRRDASFRGREKILDGAKKSGIEQRDGKGNS